MKKGLSAFAFLLALSCGSPAQPVIALEEIASGFTKPVDISHAGDARLFITEQTGFIRIIAEDGTVLAEPFLDISGPVNDSGNERGLLGLAFHPDYANNGYFFVNYTGSGGHTRISRFSVSATDPNAADPDSEVILLTVDQPFSNHNGGELAFGPDGYLYIGMGDGGSANDPQNNGQTAGTLLGKMLRIDVDSQDAGLNYAIPPSNPYADPNDGIPGEIWAFGMRNPWRFSFDRLTGDLWIGDVGQGEWEEINFQPASSAGGENYGWRCYEGTHAFNLSGCGPAQDYVMPVFEYSHTASGGCSVTGGFVYRGCAFPGLYGYYIFADYCNGQFWAIAPAGEVITLSNLSNLQYTSFGENYLGELFVTGHGQGRIYRVVETSGPTFSVEAAVTDETCEGAADGAISLSWTSVNEPVSVLWDNQATGPELENLPAGTYCAAIQGANGCQTSICLEVPQGQFNAPEIVWNDTTLSVPAVYQSYQWYLDEVPIPDATDAAYTPLQSGSYTVEVTNEAGCSAVSGPSIIVIQSLTSKVNEPEWSIAPNPFSQTLDFKAAFTSPGAIGLKIFHADGRLIYERSWERAAEASLLIETTGWPLGAYWVWLEAGGGRWSRKVLKQ
ncbi:MAG: PQQ-dependent sugar dehydrogenase [Saprospiraceae bacterium]